MQNYIINYWLLEESLLFSAPIRKNILNYYSDYNHIKWRHLLENWKDLMKSNVACPFSEKELQDVRARMVDQLKHYTHENRSILTPYSQYFSNVLKNSHPKVNLIYAKGDVNLLNSKKVAIVGSRKPTAYGRKIAYDLGRYLAQQGITVVSGMALGIDAQSHKGALDGGGQTIAVMPTDIDTVYPKTNIAIYNRINSSANLILSEYREQSEPKHYHFPLRNRIISGISDLVVIVEAGEKSGTLITAAHALDQGIPIVSVPGNITSELSKGTNRLIFDGALPLFNFELILELLDVKPQIHKRLSVDLSESARIVYEILLKRKKMTLNDLNFATCLEYSEINAALNELILEDLCDFVSLDEIELT
ncbi:MAG: DNA protecting protein DprA [Clostridiales bacterium 38-18]|nr:MAG: DNA protecting protein DprA [Clostridiales bacterium 38-18]